MIVIDNLDKRFNSTPLGDSFGAHSFCDLEWVSIHSSHNGMRKRFVLGSFIKIFYNDGFLSSKSTLKK